MDTLAKHLLNNARQHGDRPALLVPICKNDPELGLDPISWKRLALVVIDVAHRMFTESTPRTESPVIHHVTNSAHDLILALACQVLGRCECPLDAFAGDSYLERCRGQITGRYVEIEEKRQWIVDAFANVNRYSLKDGDHFASKILPDDDALVLWTSGTSGGPKGVVLSHRGLLANARAKLVAAPQRPDDIRLTVLSIAHAYARTCDIGTWLLSGSSLAITRGFDGWSHLAKWVQPTLCNAVPSLAERLIQTAPGQALRLLGVGGAAMGDAQFQECSRHGVTVIQGYGATETGPVICSQTPTDSIPGHVGRVVQGWQWRTDQERLYVKGESLMKRYWGDASGNGARTDVEGWFDTGDLVTQSSVDGQFRVIGRADDRLVLANGFNVDPVQVERTFESLPGVSFAYIRATEDKRGVEAWLEGQISDMRFDSIIGQLAQWERPKAIHEIRMTQQDRIRLFSRKGNVRRHAMSEFVDRFL